MANPLHGIYLNGRYYNYLEGSWKINIPLKNNSDEPQTQGATINRVFSSVNGRALDQHSIAIVLENAFFVYSPDDNSVMPGVSGSNGITTWSGVSRLDDLKIFIGGRGVSMPLLFMRPDGVTQWVVPTGSIDASPFLKTPESTGIEYRVNLTLEQTLN